MDFKGKTVLVTGGTGFIGSHVTNRLVEENLDNIHILSESKEFLWRIEDLERINFWKIDLRNQTEIRNLISKIEPNIIFHMAAFVNAERKIENINKAYSVNFEGTKNLIMSLNDIEYDLVINMGTSEEYGKNPVPFNEELKEDPVSPYSASKVASTYFCEMMTKIFNHSIITIRPTIAYGPKQISKALIPSLIYYGFKKKTLDLTPCEQTRDFLFVEDLIDALILLAKNFKKVKDMGLFNIGYGEEIPIKRVVNLINKEFQDAQFKIGGKEYRKGETMHYYTSIEKLKSIINWKPNWTIEKGISKTIKWWKNNRNIWQKYQNLY